VQRHKQKDIRDLIGKLLFEDGYRTTYKAMRKDGLSNNELKLVHNDREYEWVLREIDELEEYR